MVHLTAIRFSKCPSCIGKPCFDFTNAHPASGNLLFIFVWPFPASGLPFLFFVGTFPHRASRFYFSLALSRVGISRFRFQFEVKGTKIPAISFHFAQELHKNLIFLSIIAPNWDKLSNFAPANSRRADFARCRSGYREGTLHIEMRRWRFVFGSSKFPQSNWPVKDIAEVDATGRYIAVPLACRGSCSLMHAFTGVLYIPTAWVSICLFSGHRPWKASNCEQAEARYPAFLL